MRDHFVTLSSAEQYHGHEVPEGEQVYIEKDGIKYRGSIVGRGVDGSIIVDTLYDNDVSKVEFFRPCEVYLLLRFHSLTP